MGLKEELRAEIVDLQGGKSGVCEPCVAGAGVSSLAEGTGLPRSSGCLTETAKSDLCQTDRNLALSRLLEAIESAGVTDELIAGVLLRILKSRPKVVKAADQLEALKYLNRLRGVSDGHGAPVVQFRAYFQMSEGEIERSIIRVLETLRAINARGGAIDAEVT